MPGRLLAGLAAGTLAAALAGPALAQDRSGGVLDAAIARHARANGLPEALVHRVVQRESRYNPRAVGRGGAMGLMQIKHGTARAMGYSGPPSGLLDAETNLTYAVRYLAGAYRVADGDPDRTVSFYARGYYYEARRRGLPASVAPTPVEAEEPVAAPAAPTGLAALFGASPAPAPAPVAVVAVEAAPQASAFAPVRGRAGPARGPVVLPPARPPAFGRAAPEPETEETASAASELAPAAADRSYN